jgi:hypothetical protein
VRRSAVNAIAVAAALVVAAAPAHAATLGSRVLKKGNRGNDVAVLQRILTWKGWSPGPVDGIFGRQTKRAVKHFQRRRGLAVDGKVGPATIQALARPWKPRKTTLFGPGLYGNRTACGQTLRRRSHGVAHRTLPCGRRFPIAHAGRITIVSVIDRGPHSGGVDLDLTMHAARKLRMRTTGWVRAGY